MEKSENRRYAISRILVGGLLGVVLVISLALRLHQIGKLSFWNDEIFSFFSAKMSFGEIFNLDPNMSLFHMVAQGWIRMFPYASEGLLRILSTIFSVLSIPVVFFLGSSFVNDKKKSTVIGLLASILISVNAYHIQYVFQEYIYV